ncbi:MAG: hypothetical protein HKN04_15665 [Rhodothermaceae bacterium]|nr:hypothetical protein [Rhodothermaceae bacterium]
MSVPASPLAPRTLRPVPINLVFQHRGFQFRVARAEGRFGPQSFRYMINHLGATLHQSAADFGSAESADRAARRFIDDALGSFAYAYEHLDADC